MTALELATGAAIVILVFGSALVFIWFLRDAWRQLRRERAERREE